MKKIIYITNNLTVGGVTEVVKQTTKELIDRYNISIISLSNDISGWNDCNIPVKIFDIEINLGYKLRNYFSDTFINKKIEHNYKPIIDYIIKENPELIHFHTLPRFLKIGLLIKKQINTELVFTDHLVRISNKEYNFLAQKGLALVYRYLYKNYHLIFVSKQVEQVAKQYKFISKNKVNIKINNGIDITKYSLINKKEDAVIFIYIARISPVKGHKELINAWKKLKTKKKIELWLIGPNEMGNEIEKLISNNNTIKLLGSRNDIPELLSKADIGIFPSKKEGLPLSLLEKMASGLPVIVSNIRELTDIIEDNKDGLVYSLENENDLIEKINILLKDKELCQYLGNNARKKIENEFSIINVINQLDIFYKKILS